MSEKKKKINVRTSTQTLAMLAILVAAQMVIAQFLTIHTWNMKIGFSFIPVVIAARMYGAAGGAIVGGLGDIIGAIVQPVGAWFPPITVTNVIVGIMFGLLLKKSDNFLRVLTSVLVSELFFSLFVTTLWISILYSTANTDFWPYYFTNLISRIPQVIILIAIKMVIIPPMLKAMDRIKFTKQIINA